MRIVFFGTPEFAVPSLERLARKFEIVLVVTQPDRPGGRGRRMIAPPVKEAAKELGIDVIQPNIVKGRRFFESVQRYTPDFVITAAFGRLLGARVVLNENWICLNIHASLLPRYRGAAPANWAILNGDQETGISITRMTEALDAGPVYYSMRTSIGPRETAGELLGRLAILGAECVEHTLAHFAKLTPSPQIETDVTWARILEKEDGLINWERSAVDLDRHVRGMHPWPVALTWWNEMPLKVHRALVAEQNDKYGALGEVISVAKDGIDVACGEGVLKLLEIQAAGRKRLHVSQFLAGSPIAAGAVLGR